MDSKRFTTRKYIDMILKASAKWPNLDFGKNLEVGDYGLVNTETGDFEFHGNIYKDEVVLDLLPELRDDEYKPQLSEPIKHWIVTSNKTQQGEIEGVPAAELAGTEDASIKVKFKIRSGHRGAFLAMYSPRTVDLPKNILLHKLARLEPLKKKFLVTSVFSCPAYSLCLTDRGTESVQLAFVGNLPVASLGAGGEGGVGWKIDKSAGMYQEGCDPAGTYKYRPLYTMKQMRRPRSRIFRDSPEPIREGDDLWKDAEAPWKPLDDNGEEEDFCDDLSD